MYIIINNNPYTYSWSDASSELIYDVDNVIKFQLLDTSRYEYVFIYNKLWYTYINLC